MLKYYIKNQHQQFKESNLLSIGIKNLTSTFRDKMQYKTLFHDTELPFVVRPNWASLL
jgi:hypothetical protein